MSEPEQAERFVDFFFSPGMPSGDKWENDAGEDFCEALEKASCDKDNDWDRELTKYIFPDGSSVVLGEGAWDIGFKDCECFCWRGAGHVGCKYA